MADADDENESYASFEVEGEYGGYNVAEEEEMEVESVLTEYDPDEFHSGAVNTTDSTIPLDLFEFEHSYGYNCHKYFNLCACDDSVICWASGSIITFFDVITQQVWFRRTSTGGSVGAICSHRKDPNYRIAIAEGREGDIEPLIILYTWPQMEIDAVLRDGTTNAFSSLDFNPEGELLASVGRDPDYNLTIWNWKKHRILLRTSAFTFDVNAVLFSVYCPGQLTTAGAAHIKFWKMAETFTGLKLKGELGRFGKTEICDILGFYQMPDEKVISGCEWGNVLVWEAGLVKVEVTQRGRKSCHTAPVIQFMLSDKYDEVTTISRDGCVRAWYWETVEQADPPEEDPFVELNPVAETCVPGCQIMWLVHQKDMYWYAQDGNGGIWTVDLEIDKLECNHNKVLTTHAGAIIGMAALRAHRILITAGTDGALMAYDTESHALLARYVFQTPITCLLYPPADVDATSCILLVGFSDGVMRTLLLHPERLTQQRTQLLEVRVHSALTVHSDDSIHADVISLLSILKPHSKALVQISINGARTLLVTSGRDSTIFIYKLIHGAPFQLERLGFVETPNNVEYMTWKPNEELVLLLCGQVGFIMEVVLPDIDVRNYTDITTFKMEFVSFKETLLKKQYLRNRSFPEEEDLASIDEEALKAKDEMEDDDDDEEWKGEIELIESESLLGTTITWAQYCDAGVWVVQRGTGALLLIQPGSNKIHKFAPFEGAWCDDITSLLFVCGGAYLVVGTNTGYIRVVKMPTEEEDSEEYHYRVWMTAQTKLLKKLKGRRLAKEDTQPTPRIDFNDRYYLAMHDYYTGAITSFDFSADGKYFYTCGADGNIFSYVVNYDIPLITQPDIPKAKTLTKVHKAKEPSTLEGEMMSHEQLKQKEEFDKMMAIANAHKKRVRTQLADLATDYNKIIKANKLLPVSQQIDMTLDPRPLVVQERELDEAKALTQRKIAHQLEASDRALDKMYSRNIIQCDVYPFTLKAIRDPAVMIRPLRQKNLSKAFFDQLNEVYEKMAEAALKGRRTETTVRKSGYRKLPYGPPRVASFLLGLPPKPPHPLKKALRNYHQRLERHHEQMIEWQEHLSRKPDPNAMPPGAADALKEAEATIGNKLLKTAPEYIAPPGHNTQLRVCLTRKEIYDNKREFNAKVLKLREHKIHLVEQMQHTGERLAEIRLEIPAKKAKPPPPIPTIDDDMEFPEKNLEIKPEPTMTSAMRSAKRTQNMTERRKSALYPQPRLRQPKVPAFRSLYETKPLTATWELLKPRLDMESTEIEVEIRNRRIERHLYEQDMLLADAQVCVQEFDAQLRKLQRERIRVQEKNQLLELHLYQLHREMNVLNRFESHEDRLAERVYAKLMQVRAVQELIVDCEHRIEEHKETKESLAMACEELQTQFKKMVVDDKFADFLRRIFKKKYRPVRQRDDDESSEEESSSSSSEEEEEGSMDSRDIGPIRLDPNICPEGCSEELYHKTYDMRNTRHRHEQDMIEQDRLIELLKKDIDAHNKVKRKLSAQLDRKKNDLREFMLEKQNCLNEVDQVVVLRYDQIRASALRGCYGSTGLSQTVVFEESMLQRLRQRVLELYEEIRQQKERQKVNRTHLFRMNVDMRAMEATAEEIRAQMRDVLTKKLGKPRKVDKTLDDLLRQMARRHKFTANLGALPQILVQLRGWRDRHADLEKKYMLALHHYSDRLRLAAAIQSDVLPTKPPRDPSVMPGAYTPEQYKRDVVRLKIVRAQQEQQIQSIKAEITQLHLKPLSHLPAPMDVEMEEEEEEEPIYLFMVPRVKKQLKHKYFPITPIGSQSQVFEVTVATLINECLDAMRLSRELAGELLKDLTDQLPLVTSGAKTRYEVVDQLVHTWLAKTGGDPSRYKKQTRAFDTLAALADRLCRDHVIAMEDPLTTNQQVMGQLEAALKDVTDGAEPLQKRLGPAIAALFSSAHISEIETEETMTSLVHSLIDAEHPITADALNDIDEFNVIEDMRDCGVVAAEEDLQRVVRLAVDCLRAQLPRANEQADLQQEVQQDMQRAVSHYPPTALLQRVVQLAVDCLRAQLPRANEQADLQQEVQQDMQRAVSHYPPTALLQRVVRLAVDCLRAQLPRANEQADLQQEVQQDMQRAVSHYPPTALLQRVVQLAVDCLRAQLPRANEQADLQQEVQQDMQRAVSHYPPTALLQRVVRLAVDCLRAQLPRANEQADLQQEVQQDMQRAVSHYPPTALLQRVVRLAVDCLRAQLPRANEQADLQQEVQQDMQRAVSHYPPTALLQRVVRLAVDCLRAQLPRANEQADLQQEVQQDMQRAVSHYPPTALLQRVVRLAVDCLRAQLPRANEQADLQQEVQQDMQRAVSHYPPTALLQRVVRLAVDCLRAQLPRANEQADLQQEVQQDMQRARSAGSSSSGGRKRSVRLSPAADGADGGSTVDKAQNTERQRE